MNAFFQAHPIFAFLVAYSAVYLSVTGAILVWALRSRQFKEQDHARYLPLESRGCEIPGMGCKKNARNSSECS
jgi:hypothetical protein